MLADGGDCLADLAALRDQPTLFGEVPSDATAWRALAALDGERVAAVRRARATARACVWELAGAPERVVLDLDATLITAHSDKEQAAGPTSLSAAVAGPISGSVRHAPTPRYGT